MYYFPVLHVYFIWQMDDQFLCDAMYHLYVYFERDKYTHFKMY